MLVAEQDMKVALVLVVGAVVRDTEVLQSRRDIGTVWTSWERRDRRGR